MDKLGQISLQNTVTLKIESILNQDLLVGNFQIIMDCLKDLQAQINKHSHELAGMANLKELVEKLAQDVKHNSEMLNSHDKNQKNNSNGNNSNSQGLNQSNLQNLQKELNSLKDRVTKGEGFTTENTKDINLLNQDMKNAKQEIDALKKQLSSIKNHLGIDGLNGNSGNSNKNLGKNDNLGQEVLNKLNQQSQDHQQTLNKFQKEISDMKKHIKKLEDDITGLKTNTDQLMEDKKFESSNNVNENATSNDGTVDSKVLNDLAKKIEYLNKKAENIQSQVNNNTRCLHELNETADKTTQELDQQKENINNINGDIQYINGILERLQNNGGNGDNGNLMDEIEKLKKMYEKLLKMINDLKNSSKSDGDSIDNENRGLNRNMNNKNSQDRSFRKRSDSVSIDVNKTLKELADRIKYLEKMLEKLQDSENPEKLPPIGFKKGNQTSYNPEKSHKKEMAEMKNDLEIWIKAYLDNLNKGQGNLTEIELKLQEIKNILGRKADHEGMKKGLAFLEGKITQLYMFLTEPESQDAMIVRKGFNCLSCSKKVQSLRGKLGPRMNWDNLNVNHGQTPPKVGFPKYADSNQKESI